MILSANVYNFAKYVKNFIQDPPTIDIDEIFNILENMGKSIEGIEAELSEISAHMAKIQNLRKKKNLLWSEISNSLNLFEIHGLQQLFLVEENQAVASEFIETEFGLFVHKKCAERFLFQLPIEITQITQLSENNLLESQQSLPLETVLPSNEKIKSEEILKPPITKKKLKEFRSTLLEEIQASREKQILEELSKPEYVGARIPQISEINNRSFGYIEQDGHIVGLSLYKKEIKKIPVSIKHFKWLKEMYLCNNNLQEIPETIGELISLEILDLDYNHLKSLPQGIGNLESLKVFSLYNNKLETLPEVIGNLKSLIKLDLCGNPANLIFNLPESIISLPNLQELIWDSNQNFWTPHKQFWLKQIIKGRRHRESFRKCISELGVIEKRLRDIEEGKIIKLIPKGVLRFFKIPEDFFVPLPKPRQPQKFNEKFLKKLNYITVNRLKWRLKPREHLATHPLDASILVLMNKSLSNKYRNELMAASSKYLVSELSYSYDDIIELSQSLSVLLGIQIRIAELLVRFGGIRNLEDVKKASPNFLVEITQLPLNAVNQWIENA